MSASQAVAVASLLALCAALSLAATALPWGAEPTRDWLDRPTSAESWNPWHHTYTDSDGQGRFWPWTGSWRDATIISLQLSAAIAPFWALAAFATGIRSLHEWTSWTPRLALATALLLSAMTLLAIRKNWQLYSMELGPGFWAIVVAASAAFLASRLARRAYGGSLRWLPAAPAPSAEQAPAVPPSGTEPGPGPKPDE